MPKLAQTAAGNHGVFWDAIFFLGWLASHGGAEDAVEVPEEITEMVEAIAAVNGQPVLFVESN
jgi:hypothetical protein